MCRADPAYDWPSVAPHNGNQHRLAETWVQEESEVDEGWAAAKLPDAEAGQEERPRQQAGEDESVAPAPSRLLDDPIYETGDAGDCEGGSDEVGTRGVRFPALGYEQPDAHPSDHHDGTVDQQD